MDELIRWLRAQLDEDERKANDHYEMRPEAPPVSTRHCDGYVEVSVAGGRLRELTEAEYVDEFMVPRPDQRMLREVEAKREIIRKWEVDHGNGYPDYSGGYESALEDVIAVIAAIYSDRPGYQEEWR